jgi:cytoskeletal protein RodZ
MKCKFCGEELGNSTKFCPNCGRTIYDENKKKKNYSNVIVFIICIVAVLIIAAVIVFGFFVFHNSKSEEYVTEDKKISGELKEKTSESRRSLYESEYETDPEDEYEEKFTENATETTTEELTEALTEAPTQKPTEAQTEAPTEAPTQVPTEAPTETPTQAPTEAPTSAPTPEFTRAEATSILADIVSGGKTYSYYPSLALDGDNSTCWCEGADGDGLGEAITLFTDDLSTIGKITIANGLCADYDTFYKNNRVRECELTFSDGTTYTVELNGDFEAQPCVITLPESVETEYVKITILSVYSGTKYTDTCISEISAE